MHAVAVVIGIGLAIVGTAAVCWAVVYLFLSMVGGCIKLSESDDDDENSNSVE